MKLDFEGEKMISMKKVDFMKIAINYTKCIDVRKPFKLKDIIGDDCPTLPGKWLREEVKKGTFNTSEYIIEYIGTDSADIYIKKER